MNYRGEDRSLGEYGSYRYRSVFHYFGLQVLVFVLFVAAAASGDFCLLFAFERSGGQGGGADGSESSALAFGAVLDVQLPQSAVHEAAEVPEIVGSLGFDA